MLAIHQVFGATEADHRYVVEHFENRLKARGTRRQAIGIDIGGLVKGPVSGGILSTRGRDLKPLLETKGTGALNIRIKGLSFLV